MATEDRNSGGFAGRMKKLFREPERKRESLPSPPEGMEWVQKPDTKEWRLVKVVSPSASQNEMTATSSPPPVPVSPERVVVDKLPPRASPPPTTTTTTTTTTAAASSTGAVVDRLPHLKIGGSSNSNSNREEDWELLSDRLSGASSNHTSSGTGGTAVLVQRSAGVISAGSVRSIASLDENDNNNEHGSHNSTTLSLPFKFQRTASSSTIDSADDHWPTGQGILGVDYVEHVILPTDTLQGVCLAYKISSTRLRQANHFSGNSLLLAPKKLVIPLSKKALRSGFIRVQDTDAKEYKLHAFLAEFPDMSITEAKAYLELADWVLKDAVRSARDDGEWEQEMDHCSLRSGEIRITFNKSTVPVKIQTQGAGIQPRTGTTSSKKKTSEHNKSSKPQVTSIDAVTIATKTVRAQDLYQAGEQHNNFGVELKSLSSSSSSTGGGDKK